MIVVSRRALGSPKDLVHDGNDISWASESDGWILGDRHQTKSVEAIYETVVKEVPDPIPSEYRKSMDGLARGDVPWPLVIPSSILREHVASVSSGFNDIIDELDGYEGVLENSRRVLSSLQPCRIDLMELRVCQSGSSTHVLDSFEPGTDSMCPAPIYSHATATGRLTILEGPRILTLQKEHRRVLASRFNGGKVMQIDFVSLEPRVLRLLKNGSAPIDIYADVAQHIGGGADRRHVKLATLKMLYGSSKAGIVESVGELSGSSIRKIEDYFGLANLRSRLMSMLKERGRITSHWGRPLPEANEQHLLVSHFTQSTAVDVALGGFGDLLEVISSEDLDVVPCFVLHDALIVDVHPLAMVRLEEIVSQGLEIESLGRFEISLSPAYVSSE